MSGLLNKILTDGSVQLVGTIPNTGTFSSINLLAANDTTQDISLRVWIGTDATPSQVDLVDPQAIVPGKGRYEDTVRITSPGENVFVQAAVGLVVRVETVDEV